MRRLTAVLLALLVIAGVAQAGTVNLAWNPSSGAQGYEIHYGTASGNYTVSVDTGQATTAALSGLTNGQTHYFAALAYNTAGDSAYSNEVSATPNDPDTTPPTASITNPANGATVPRGQNVTISASASDNVGVSQVTITVRNGSNQVIKTCGDSTAPYQCVWAVPSPPGRTYTIQATATDAANNTGTSAVVQVTSQ